MGPTPEPVRQTSRRTSAFSVSSGDHRAAAQPGLLRQLGLYSATAIVISNMIGTGIFTATGFLAGQLGDPRLVLVIWLVGALFALCGAFCFSELGINFPASGGEYVYLTRAYGPTLGFMSGWTSFFAGFSAPIAAAALAFADYLGFLSRRSNRRTRSWHSAAETTRSSSAAPNCRRPH